MIVELNEKEISLLKNVIREAKVPKADFYEVMKMLRLIFSGGFDRGRLDIDGENDGGDFVYKLNPDNRYDIVSTCYYYPEFDRLKVKFNYSGKLISMNDFVKEAKKYHGDFRNPTGAIDKLQTDYWDEYEECMSV